MMTGMTATNHDLCQYCNHEAWTLTDFTGLRLCKYCYEGVGRSERDFYCHCGDPVTYGYDGDPTHTRGLCVECDMVRCDAYLGECEK